jgi:hypothetical protein
MGGEYQTTMRDIYTYSKRGKIVSNKLTVKETIILIIELVLLVPTLWIVAWTI